MIGICMVFVRSRYFSTLFSSFLMRSAAPSGNGADLCFLWSKVVTKVWFSSPSSPSADSLSSYSSVICQINALLSGLKFLLLVKALAYGVRWFGFIVVLTARNGGPLTNFVIQLIFGLNSFSQGYLRIKRSLPKLVTRNLIIFDVSPWKTATGSQCLIIPSQFSDPSTFRSPMGESNSRGLTPSLFAVLMSMQFSLALQSISAFSVVIPCRPTNLSGSQTSLAM